MGRGIAPLESAGLYTNPDSAPGQALLNGHIRFFISNSYSGPGIIPYLIFRAQVFLILSIVGDKIAFKVGFHYTTPKTSMPFIRPYFSVTIFRTRPAAWRPGTGLIAHGRCFTQFIKIAKYRVESPLNRAGGIPFHYRSKTGLAIKKRIQIGSSIKYII